MTQTPERFSLLEDGCFKPFDQVWRCDNFEFKEPAEKLGLNRPQQELLEYMLRDLKIRACFSFVDEDEESPPRREMELYVVWDAVDAEIAACRLSDLLESSLEDIGGEIGCEKEIEALLLLRDQIDKAIQARRDELEGGTDDGT